MLAPDLDWVLGLRFVQGIGGSSLVSLNFALAGDLFQGRERVRATGNIAALQNVGSGLLPILGGALASIAWFWPFALPLIGIPIGIYIIYFLEPTETKSDTGTRAFLGYAWHHLMDRRVIELLAMTAGFIFAGFGAFVTYMPLYLKDTFATPEILIGVVLAARSVSGVIVATQLSKFTERYSYRTLISGAFVALGTGMVIVPFLPSVWAVMLTAVIYGGSFAIIRASLQLLLIEIAPSDLLATFTSAGSFFLRFGQTIAPIAAGFMIVLGGYQALYFAAAAFAFLFAGYAATAVVLRRA
jgi:ACDE family multidrug resistance protein